MNNIFFSGTEYGSEQQTGMYMHGKKILQIFFLIKYVFLQRVINKMKEHG